jgi:hypothetical protein
VVDELAGAVEHEGEAADEHQYPEEGQQVGEACSGMPGGGGP